MNQKNVIILITPSSGGKDYFLEILQEEIQKNKEKLRNVKFAGVTRKIVKHILFKQLIKEKIYTTEYIKSLTNEEAEKLFDKYKNERQDYILWENKNVRKSLQTISEKTKYIDKNIHVAFALKEIIETNEGIPLISDGRFENEILAIYNFNKSKNKKLFLKKYISSLNLPKEENIENELKKIFIDDKQNKKELEKTKYIISEMKSEITNLYKYKIYTKDIYNEMEKFNLNGMSKEDFLDKNIIILTRYITPKDIESQKKQYKMHKIDFNDSKYKIDEKYQRYIGSAHPDTISEEFSFKMPTGYLNATDSDNLKNNLLPIVIEKIMSDTKMVDKKRDKSTKKNRRINKNKK